MKPASIRTRLTWAFLLVAVAVTALVMIGFNAAFWGTIQGRMMGRGAMMRWGGMQGQVMGQGAMTGRGPMARQEAGLGEGAGAVTMWGTLYEGRSLAFRVSLLAGGVGLVLAAGVSYVVAERLTRSIRGLADAARQGRPGSFAAHPTDPVELRELSGALNRMTESLQAEDEMRRQHFADIAHELRHPIALLRGRLEMLQDGVTPVTPEALSGLQDEVIRLGRIVDDLRELSLAEVGKLSLDLQPVDLLQEIAITRENFEPIAADKSIALVVDAEALPPVPADPDRIRQILANLLSNAIRHTPQGGRITVTTARKGDQVSVSVADSGPGIDPADAEQIFDRFFRADRSRTRSTGGTGLGLAIARSLARLHGGDLTAANGLGGGALFVLTLPITPGATAPS